MAKNKKPAKGKPTKLQLTFDIGAAVAAVGLLLLYLFVSKEEMKGSTFYHLLQITLTLLAVICAFGVAYSAFNKRVSKKQE